MSGASLGEGCTLGQNIFVGKNVQIGSKVKIQNNVSVFEVVTLEDDVFCGPGMVFTNKTEIMGRLVACGFSIADYRRIGYLT